MVEMALVLPLVGMIAFGIIDLGRAYRLKTSLANAAHEGAAYAQYNPSQVSNVGACADPNNIVFASRNEEGTSKAYAITVQYTAQATEDPPATWTTVSGCSVNVPAGRVIVTASSPFTLLTPLVAAIVGPTMTLRERSEVIVQ